MPLPYCSKYHNAFAYLIDAMIRLTLPLNADFFAIFLTFCNFYHKKFSRVKKLTLNVFDSRLKSAMEVHSILHLRNVEVNFHTFYIYRITFNSCELNETFYLPHCREEIRKL